MKKWMQKNKLYLIGALAGASSGFLYWKFVGCIDGTCAITSSPVNSTIYFSFVGMLVFGLFKKDVQAATKK